MKSIVPVAAVAFLAAFTVVAVAPDASAAARHRSTYDAKKAECTRKADAKRFGIHRIQRNRWIKNCIAGGAA
jgi:hypothetical protein